MEQEQDRAVGCRDGFSGLRDGYWWCGWALLYPLRLFRVLYTIMLVTFASVFMCLWPSWHESICDTLSLDP